MIKLPLRNRRREIVAWAIIDNSDKGLSHFSWHLSDQHVCRSGNPGTIYLHREIMGNPPGLEVDHKDGDPLNNRRSNLRVATHAEQNQNIGSRGGSSKYRGVSWATKRGAWLASVKINNKSNHLGYFEREEDAALAASEFRREHMPFSNEQRHRAN